MHSRTAVTGPLLTPSAAFPLTLATGRGDRVRDCEGRTYRDFYGGHCVLGAGHAHPKVVAAIARQAEKLAFYSTAANVPVRDAAARALTAFAPENMQGVFFCNSGAEANENALKLAIRLTGRDKIVAFGGAFHGRTLLALAATDNAGLREPFVDFMPEVVRRPFGDAQALEAADFADAAAVIVEPVQSMAGVRVAPSQWLRDVVEKAHAAGAFVILDEVQTGMGRLGAPFAADHFGIAPDFITCAKGIASGVPMGALLVDGDIVPRIPANALGSTFGGSPLACAALLATLEIIDEEGLCTRALEVEARLRTGFAGSVVEALCGRGALLGMHAGEYALAVKEHLFRRRILVGASADPAVLRLMPPLNVSDEAVSELIEAVHDFHDGTMGIAAEAAPTRPGVRA